MNSMDKEIKDFKIPTIEELEKEAKEGRQVNRVIRNLSNILKRRPDLAGALDKEGLFEGWDEV